LAIAVVNIFKLKEVRLKVSRRAGHPSLAHKFAACSRGVLFPSDLNSLFTSLGGSELWGPQKVANFLGCKTWSAIKTPSPPPPRKMGEVLEN